jgi:hypothetical protein
MRVADTGTAPLRAPFTIAHRAQMKIPCYRHRIVIARQRCWPFRALRDTPEECTPC